MDKGYKMTNYPCTFCQTVTFTKPGTSSINCPKCDKEYEPEMKEEDDKVEEQYDEFLKEYSKVSEKQNKSQDVSKKIGAKLIQGWTMLGDSCNCKRFMI